MRPYCLFEASLLVIVGPLISLLLVGYLHKWLIVFIELDEAQLILLYFPTSLDSFNMTDK